MNRITAAAALGISLFVLGTYGCSSDSSGGTADVDSGTPPVDGATPPADATQNGDGATPPVDAALPPADAAAPQGDGGAPLGATCTVGTDCASGLCEGFRQQTVMLCTNPCVDGGDVMTECPNPPTAGSCTPKGYCKFN